MSVDKISIGDAIYIAVKPILKIYSIIFLGWLTVKFNIMSMETGRGLSSIVLNVLVPCLTFSKVVTNLSGSKIKEIGVVILTAIIMFGAGGVLALIVKKLTPVPKKWTWGLIFCGLFGNVGDLPISYVQSLGTGIVFDQKDVDVGVALAIVFSSFQMFLIMNVGLFQIVGMDFKESEENAEMNGSESGNLNITNSVPSRGGKETSKVQSSDLEPNTVPFNDIDDAVSAYGMRSIDSRVDVEQGSDSGTKKDFNSSLRRMMSRESQYSSRSRHRKQNAQSLINEYSEADVMKHQTIDQLARTISKTQIVGLNLDEEEDKVNAKRAKWDTFIKKYNLGWIEYILANFKRPQSAVLLVSIIISMIPWLRCLFVKNSINIKQAPDGLPVLNFIMDFATYVGNAAVPIGLLLLGATIARLEIQEIPRGFWKASVLMVICRLCILPILGVLWVNMCFRNNWIEADISRFVLIISWAVPSATTQVYFTAFYTPLEGKRLQMDCLAILLMMQYPVMIITFPFVVSYVLKVTLGF